ncbi:hypothetical protein SGRIM128S_06960 [Streptomyces griseomycini]
MPSPSPPEPVCWGRCARSPSRCASPHPLSFEELEQASGLVLYRAGPRLPGGRHTLTVSGLRDRAEVFLDGVPLGVLDRETASLEVTGRGERACLELLVENQGRVNYGPRLGEHKGILGGVAIGRRLVHGWTMHRLPLDTWTPDDLARAVSAARPDGSTGFLTARFAVAEPADGFLALPGFAKGFVWANGTLLGRYWEIGPQRTLYLPAPLLVPGDNTLTLLELQRRGDRVDARGPELGPTEEYVETLDEREAGTTASPPPRPPRSGRAPRRSGPRRRATAPMPARLGDHRWRGGTPADSFGT